MRLTNRSWQCVTSTYSTKLSMSRSNRSLYLFQAVVWLRLVAFVSVVLVLVGVRWQGASSHERVFALVRVKLRNPFPKELFQLLRTNAQCEGELTILIKFQSTFYKRPTASKLLDSRYSVSCCKTSAGYWMGVRRGWKCISRRTKGLLFSDSQWKFLN